MKLSPVESSMMTHMGYDSGVLVVQFNGGQQYQYENIPEKLWELLQSIAQSNDISLGSTFHWTVRKWPDAYPCKPLKKKMPVD